MPMIAMKNRPHTS